MKKIAALLLTLAMLPQSSAAYAADSSTPAKLETAVTEQLLEHGYDNDEDGSISTAELSAIHQLSLDLTNVTDLSFLCEIPHLQILFLEKGNFTDLSILTRLPDIFALSLFDMTLDDLSFLQNMQLTSCQLENVKCKTPFDKTQLLRVGDLTFEQGYQETIEVLPSGLFDDSAFEITVDDHDIIFEDDEYGSNSGYQNIYTLAEGKTTYHVFLEGKEFYKGNITVKPKTIMHEPIRNDVISWANYVYPEGTGSVVDALVGNRVFHCQDGKITMKQEGVSALYSVFLDSISGSSSFHVCVLELHQDGTLYADGEQVLPEEHFVSIHENCALTDDNKLYGVYREKDQNIWIMLSDHCAESLASEDFPLFLSTDGKVCLYTINASKQTASVNVTKMAKPIQYFYDYLIDENHDVWYYSKGTLKKVAENAVEIGIYPTDDGDRHSCYLTADGSAYLLNGNGQVNIVEEPDCEMKHDLHDSFFFGDWYASGEKSEADCGGRWTLSNDGILSLSYCQQRFAIDNAANVFGEGYDAQANRHYVFFARKDASIWRYCIESNSAEQVIAGESPKETLGDLNQDGKVTVSDAVLIEKWLTMQTTATFALQNADMNHDKRITAVDLTLLKRALLNG